MRIDEARIDAYGEKSNAIFDFSRGPFYLAFGPNEAGKSSFLEFIRNLLFDRKPGGESEAFFSNFGAATLGGSAKFRLDDGRTGSVRRSWKLGETRRRSEFEGSLRNPETGADLPLDEETFARLLGGADRRLFATYFGFSHEELRTGESLLKETGISELIYGFGVGGPKTFNEAKKSLKRELDASFSAAGNAKKQKINAVVLRLKALDSQTKGAFGSARAYSTLCKERDSVALELEKIRDKREKTGVERRAWEKKRTARALFEAAESAANDATTFLENSPFSAERLAAFPVDGIAEWKAVSDALHQFENEIEGLTENFAASQAKIAQIERLPNFLAEQARIRGAARRIEEIARERTELPEDSARNVRDAEELERRGAEIGVDAAAFRTETTISDAALERARAGAAEEARLAGEARTAEKTARDRRDEIAELERLRETEESRRIDEFGARDRTDDATDFRRVEKAFLLIRDAAERAEKEGAALQARRDAEQKTARRLIRGAFAKPSDDFDVDFQRLENADVPLATTLNELERRGVEIEKERDSIKANVERLDAEIERLDERLNASSARNAASADELARRRRDRDERWSSIKTDWLEERDVDPAARVASVGRFERAVERADLIADSRFENAKSIVEWDAATRTRAAKEAERAGAAERMRFAEEAAVQLAKESRELWRRSGLDVRADFSLAEGKEWRLLWENWATARAETRRQATEIFAETSRLRQATQETARVAARWLDGANDDGIGEISDALVINSDVKSDVNKRKDETELQSAVVVAERLVARAEKRVERWRAALDQEREIAERIDEAILKLNRFELDAKSAATELKKLDAGRRSFLNDLANATISIDGDAARGSFAELASTLEKWRDLQKETRRIAGEKARIVERTERIAEFEREVADLAVALGVEPFDARTRAEDAVCVWAERLQDALDAENAWKTETQNAAQLKATLDAKKSAAEVKKARRKELAATVEAASEDDFLAIGEAAAQARRLNAERDATAARLRAAFFEQDDAEFAQNIQSLRAVDGAEVDAKIAEFIQKSNEIDAQEKTTNARLVEICSKIAVLEQKEGAARFAVEREGTLNELREAIDLFVPRLFACRALENSLRRCEEEKRPKILEDANKIFERVTSGRYSRIDANQDSFAAIQRDGILKSPRELSSGTREQLYLALRLAHIRRYCESSESLPLLTDDVLVNFDDARAEETLRVLAEFAQQTQVILLTCRESTRRAFERVVGKESIVELTGRRFDG